MFQTLLVAVDSSEESEAAVQHAFGLARAFAVKPLHIVTVVDIYGAYYATPESIQLLKEEGQDLLRKFSTQAAAEKISIESHFLVTDVGGERVSMLILNRAAYLRADLIILGSHGRRGFQKLLLGSVATEVSQRANCSVLIVHALP